MEPEIEAKRQLAVFADDLFRYLLQKRLNVEDLCPPLRQSNDPTTSHYPVVGLSILCLSHSKQEEYFKYFAKHIPVIIKEYKGLEVENYGRFCVVANDHFNSKFENVYEKIVNLGCLVLELSAFCDVQGYKPLKYFSSNIWADMIYRKFGMEIFKNDGWNELIRFASVSVEAYIERHNEIFTDQSNRTNIKTEKLREFDLWASMLSVHTLQGISTFGVEPPRLTFSPNRVTPIKILHKDILIRFLGSIIEDIDLETEEFFRLIKDLGNTVKLMNNELYLQVIVEMIKILGMKMRSFDLLQLAQLVITENETLATFCFLTIQYAYGFRSEQDVMNIFSIISGETYHFASHSSANASPLKGSPVKSSRKLGATPKVTGKKSMGNEISNKRLVREFKRVIERNNDAAGKEICRHFKSEPKSNLLDNTVFRKVMELTWQHSENRWENIWILSLMRSLQPNLKTGLDFGISVFRNFSPLDPELLAETLMRELVKNKSDIFKFAEEQSQTSYKQLSVPKYTSIIGAAENIKLPVNEDVKDISEAACEKVTENREKPLEKRLAAEKYDVERPHPEAKDLETLRKNSSLEVNKGRNSSKANKLSSNELTKEKQISRRVKASHFTENLFPKEKVLVPHEGTQVNISESNELIAFPNLKEFMGKYFRSLDPNDLCKKSGKSEVSISTTSVFPGGTDSSLKPVDVETVIDSEKDNVNADKTIAKENTGILENISLNPNLANELEDYAMKREAEEKILNKLSELEDLKNRMKMFLVESKMQNLNINEEETDKEVKSGVRLLDTTREPPKEFPNVQSQSYDENSPSDIITPGHSSITIIQSPRTSDVSHSDGILSTGQLSSDTPHLKTPDYISPDILSAYRSIMDLLQIEDSSYVFNGTLQQTIEQNPDVLKTLKVKCIIDKQIKKELLKYHDRYHDICKDEQLLRHTITQDKSSIQTEL